MGRGPVHFVVVGQVSPRAACSQHVEDRIDIFTDAIGVDGSAALVVLVEQQRGQDRPRLVGQIGWVAGAGKWIHTRAG